MDDHDFSYQSFSNILDSARKASNKYEYKCCIPNCNKKALRHSHIVPQCVLKKYLCNSKHELIQCQIDEIHPMSVADSGDLPFEKFVTIGIEKSMSMPVFCAEHDNSLFEEYERNADAIIPKDSRFQVLQSLRAIGALRHREERLLVQNYEKGKCDSFYKGEIYEAEKRGYEYLIKRYNATIASLYETINNDDFCSFEFVCVKLEQIGLVMCDAIVDEFDCERHCHEDNYVEPFKVLYIHLLPKGEHSYLIMGYDKRYVSSEQKKLLKKWSKQVKNTFFLRTIYEILCHCSNNWCVSPDCDETIIEWLRNNYTIDSIKT